MKDVIEILKNWQTEQIDIEKKKGGEILLGIPDRWYENPTYADVNGHISNMYLKSSMNGNVCLECNEPIFIVPPETTEEFLQTLLTPPVASKA